MLGVKEFDPGDEGYAQRLEEPKPDQIGCERGVGKNDLGLEFIDNVFYLRQLAQKRNRMSHCSGIFEDPVYGQISIPLVDGRILRAAGFQSIASDRHDGDRVALLGDMTVDMVNVAEPLVDTWRYQQYSHGATQSSIIRDGVDVV
jgi:hypothetical protein